jgi:ribosomal protein L7/L12
MHIDDDILTLVAQGDYLDAARQLQSRRGITLDEAAAEIDRLRGDITPLDPASAADPITPEIAAAIRAGRKIEAIKLYRQAHGVGLKEAKDAVDAYEAATRGSPRSNPKSANPAKTSLLRRLLGG